MAGIAHARNALQFGSNRGTVKAMSRKDATAKIVGVGAVISSNARLEAKARHRSNLSIQHLSAAAYFSRRVAEIERAHAGETFGAFFEEIFWFGSACVLSCAAGLEAYVNELFIDRAEHFPDLRPDVAKKLWELIERKRLLEEFDLALLLKQKPALNRDSGPTLDVAALVALRNGLTHFKPEWDDEQAAHLKLSRKLENRFAPSSFLPSGESIFPRRWATHGCTKWAVKSCIDFLTDFESRSGVPERVAKHATRLSG
jgi:hypothetical protein